MATSDVAVFEDTLTELISRGQAKAEEETIARAVGNKLQELGFDFYIGVQEQMLRGLKEHNELWYAKIPSSGFQRDQLFGIVHLL